MSTASNPYRDFGMAVDAPVDARASFITKTYMHLLVALAGLAALDTIFLSMPGVDDLVFRLLSLRYAWLLVMVAFMGVSWIANSWAMSGSSQGMQYAGLALYVVAQAVIMVPLLVVARSVDPNSIPIAAVVTGVLFAGLTAVVFATRKDFSFLRGVLMFGGFAMIALIVLSILFGFNLNVFFVGAGVALACGFILYDTSNVLLHYRVDQHVAASLALFASVALLFWYILQFVLSFTSRD
jgi:FtsH-binding integral membrane protein